MADAARPGPEPGQPFGIRDLVSYRLSRTAGLMSRGAALRYRRELDVSLGEWRAVALLAGGAAQSLMQLSRAAGLDKAQMSRVVASLTRRGLVLREVAPHSRSAVALSLTTLGRRLYAGLIAAAAERDAAFRAALTPGELAALESALDKLAVQARHFIQVEEARASPPLPQGAGGDADEQHDAGGGDDGG